MGKRVLWLWGLAVVALIMPAELVAQDRRIAGRVTRSGSQDPVVAAEIVVLGQLRSISTIAGSDGRFVVEAPPGEVRLQVRALGYARAEVVVAANQNSVDIQLQPDVFRLDELVVTGQATTVGRRSATTAVSYVTGDEVSRVSAATALDALNGKVTGVNLQTNSGAPGGGIQIQIRGNNTILGAYDPLFVVDGVGYSNASIPSGRGLANNAASPSTEADAVNRIADLNPSDIESIEILKGAAASSIYGSKAANGVVVITTKRGQAGAPRINVTQRFGMFAPLRLIETRHWTADSAVARFGAAASQFFTGNANPYFDHYGDVYGQKKLSYETIADVSGGSLSTRYLVSGGWKRDEGIERNTGAGRQTIRLNVDHTFSPELDLKVSTAYTHNENDRGWNNNCNNYGCHGYAIAYIPSFLNLKQKNADGTYPRPALGVQSNPMQLTDLGVNHEETNRFTGGLNVTWSAFESDRQSLRVVAAGGLDTFDQGNDVWSRNELFYEVPQALPGESIESGGRSLLYNWNVNGIHTFNGSAFSASTSFGLQFENRRFSTFQIRSTNLLPGQRNVNQGTNITATENLTRERTIALYAQESINLLEERLLIQAGLRAERSSVNGDIDKYYVFPKVSGAYRMANLLGSGSEVKVRAAYGETGNQPLFGQKFTNLGTPQLGGQQGFTVATVSGFPDVEPERVKEVEVGLNGEALNGLLVWELTGFQRNTTNLLLQRVPSPSSGFTQQIFNGGKIQNSGIEASLGVTPMLSRTTQWVAIATFTRYTSEVLDMAGLPAFFPAQSGFGNLGRTRIQVGRPITQIVGFDFKQEVDTLRADTLSQLGNSAPDFRVGLSNSLSHRAVSVNFVVDWQQGGDIINLTQYLHDDGRTSKDWGSAEWAKRYLGYRKGAISPYIEDASFVKLRELSVMVDVPSNLFSAMNLGARSLRVGLTGRNLFMWTKYTGLDPEVANFGAAAIRNNLDIGPYPPSRSIFLNVSVGF